PGDISGLLLPDHGGAIFRVQHVQGAEGEGGHGVPGGPAIRQRVRDDVSRWKGRGFDGLASGLLARGTWQLLPGNPPREAKPRLCCDGRQLLLLCRRRLPFRDTA
ncbi:unnamed protein product, partial [Hapterophycus canaliculatus]